MNIAQLRKHYYVSHYKHNGYFLVHDKREGSSNRFIHKYLCQVKQTFKNWNVIGYPTTTNLEVLQEQINDHVSKLQYDSDYYNPRLAEHSFVEFIIHDYLRSVGFTFENSSFGGVSYLLQHNNIYGSKASAVCVSLRGLGAEYDMSTLTKKPLPTEVEISLFLDNWSWVSVKCRREVEAIKKAFDSLMKPYFLGEGVNNIQTSDKLLNEGGVDEIVIQTLTGVLNIKSKDYKSELKEKLLRLAEAL